MQKSTWWLVGGIAALALSLGGALAWTWPGAQPGASAAGPEASYGAQSGEAAAPALPAADAVVVTIEGFAYRPAALSVPDGTTGTWVNRDADPHNVVARARGFSSSLLYRDGAWSRTFTQPGTFTYICTLHPNMVASITVTTGQDGAPPSTEGPQVAPPTAEATPTPGQGDHCAGLSEDEMRKMMDSAHGQGSYDKMHQGGTRSGTGTSWGTGWGMGGMMGGYGGMGGMMGR